MDNKTSPGPEEITNQLIKLSSPYIAGSLPYIFSWCIEQNVFLSEFLKSKRYSCTQNYQKSQKYQWL